MSLYYSSHSITNNTKPQVTITTRPNGSIMSILQKLYLVGRWLLTYTTLRFEKKLPLSSQRVEKSCVATSALHLLKVMSRRLYGMRHEGWLYLDVRLSPKYPQLQYILNPNFFSKPLSLSTYPLFLLCNVIL